MLSPPVPRDDAVGPEVICEDEGGRNGAARSRAFEPAMLRARDPELRGPELRGGAGPCRHRSGYRSPGLGACGVAVAEVRSEGVCSAGSSASCGGPWPIIQAMARACCVGLEISPAPAISHRATRARAGAGAGRAGPSASSESDEEEEAREADRSGAGLRGESGGVPQDDSEEEAEGGLGGVGVFGAAASVFGPARATSGCMESFRGAQA